MSLGLGIGNQCSGSCKGFVFGFSRVLEMVPRPDYYAEGNHGFS